MTATKTDNGNLMGKLALRRYFLHKYHNGGGTPARVMDCCQGSAVLWSRLRAEFKVESYWGLDVKPKKGRLQIDSVRVLAQAGWTENVIDIDTYGSPWKHWVALLPNVRRPLVVFLTIGQWQIGTDRTILDALGIGTLPIPPGIAVKLHEMSVSYCLTKTCAYRIILTEAKEVVSFGNARYLGLRLEPQKERRPATVRAAAGQTQRT